MANLIPNVLDRVWLAAIIDGEGCIAIGKQKAGTIRRKSGKESARKHDHYQTHLDVCNACEAIVEKCRSIVGSGSICNASHKARPEHQTVRIWRIRGGLVVRVLLEVYPYLVAKKDQARIAIAAPSSGQVGEMCYQSLKLLHHGKQPLVDFPDIASDKTSGVLPVFMCETVPIATNNTAGMLF